MWGGRELGVRPRAVGWPSVEPAAVIPRNILHLAQLRLSNDYYYRAAFNNPAPVLSQGSPRGDVRGGHGSGVRPLAVESRLVEPRLPRGTRKQVYR